MVQLFFASLHARKNLFLKVLALFVEFKKLLVEVHAILEQEIVIRFVLELRNVSDGVIFVFVWKQVVRHQLALGRRH